MPTLYIPIEVKNRELESQLYLANIAARLGFRIYIGSQRAINLLIQSKPKKGGVFLDKGGLNEYWQEFSKKCDAIALLDQEISPVLDSLDYLKKVIPQRFLPGNIPLCKRVYVVGPLAASAYSLIPECTNQVVKNFGWPRVEIWNKYQRSSTSEKIFRKYGNFLLFSSDISFTSEKKVKSSIEHITNKKIPAHENMYFEEETVKRNFEIFKEVVSILKNWDKNPAVPKIIVRPHPSEDIVSWKKALGNTTRIEVIHDGPISDWLDAAQALIHRGCTTAIEAFIKKKLILFLNTQHDITNNSLARKVSKLEIDADSQPTYEKLREWNRKSYDSEPFIRTTLNLEEKDSTLLIARDLLQLVSNPEMPVHKGLLLKRRLKFDNLRMTLGRIKWELLWITGLTPLEPPSLSLPKGIRRNDLLNIDSRIHFTETIKFRKIMTNLWEFSSN